MLNDTSVATSHRAIVSALTTCSTNPAWSASSRRSSPSPFHDRRQLTRPPTPAATRSSVATVTRSPRPCSIRATTLRDTPAFAETCSWVSRDRIRSARTPRPNPIASIAPSSRPTLHRRSTAKNGERRYRALPKEQVHRWGDRAEDEHDEVAGEEQQAGVEVDLDVHAHDGHQAVGVVVVRLEAAGALRRQRDREQGEQGRDRQEAERNTGDEDRVRGHGR